MLEKLLFLLLFRLHLLEAGLEVFDLQTIVLFVMVHLILALIEGDFSRSAFALRALLAYFALLRVGFHLALRALKAADLRAQRLLIRFFTKNWGRLFEVLPFTWITFFRRRRRMPDFLLELDLPQEENEQGQEHPKKVGETKGNVNPPLCHVDLGAESSKVN